MLDVTATSVGDCHLAPLMNRLMLCIHLICVLYLGKPAGLFEFNDPDWAPTLKLGHGSTSSSSTCDSERHERLLTRRKRSQAALVDGSSDADESSDGVACQTDLSEKSIKGMQEELQRLISENKQLRDTITSFTIGQDFFKDDNTVKDYTGLSSVTALTALYNHVADYIPYTGASALDKFQQLIVALHRMRQDSSHSDLSHKFRIKTSTSSRIFLTVLDVLYSRLKRFICWPDREQLRETMPMCFRAHFQQRVAVIVDCFELHIDRPSNLAARSNTWSSYKHHNTAKFLIGITPQGVISYISQGWGGRSSDQYIMEHCGILNYLLPGDEVLVDRGFNVAESVAMRGARLHIPSFTRGVKQLSAKDVEGTRRIANARIHVERVIGSLRQKYTILNGTLPIDYVHSTDEQPCTLDKIVTVCCALVNLCPSVVPFE